MTHHDFQTPQFDSLLKCASRTRHGCSKGFVKAASGIVPATERNIYISPHYTTTWYTTDFTNPSLKLPPIKEDDALVKRMLLHETKRDGSNDVKSLSTKKRAVLNDQIKESLLMQGNGRESGDGDRKLPPISEK